MAADVHRAGGTGQNYAALYPPQMAQLQATSWDSLQKGEEKKEGEKHHRADSELLFFCGEQQNCKHSVSRAEETEIWLKEKKKTHQPEKIHFNLPNVRAGLLTFSN